MGNWIRFSEWRTASGQVAICSKINLKFSGVPAHPGYPNQCAKIGCSSSFATGVSRCRISGMCFSAKRYFAKRFPSPIIVDVGGNPQASGMIEQSQTYRLSYSVLRFESTRILYLFPNTEKIPRAKRRKYFFKNRGEIFIKKIKVLNPKYSTLYLILCFISQLIKYIP